MSEKWKTFTANMLKVGTAECAVFCGVAAMVMAILFLLLGFWETVLVAAFLLLGVFIGGVKDKKGWLRNVVNHLFPAKDLKPYKADDVNIRKEEKQEEPANEEV